MCLWNKQAERHTNQLLICHHSYLKPCWLVSYFRSGSIVVEATDMWLGSSISMTRRAWASKWQSPFPSCILLVLNIIPGLKPSSMAAVYLMLPFPSVSSQCHKKIFIWRSKTTFVKENSHIDSEQMLILHHHWRIYALICLWAVYCITTYMVCLVS